MEAEPPIPGLVLIVLQIVIAVWTLADKIKSRLRSKKGETKSKL